MIQQQQQQQQQHQTFRRALHWTILWISLAGVFAVIVYVTLGQEKALLFATGYALEKSLSVDNMFVFLLIFSSLGIPYIYQHKVLMVGILSAIAMRIGLILAGVSLLESFHWMILCIWRIIVVYRNTYAYTKERKEDRNRKKYCG